MGEWSPVCQRCTWVHPALGPKVGAGFIGHNRMAGLRWSRECEVLASDPGVEFAFHTILRGRPSTHWRYLLVPNDSGGTDVAEQYTVTSTSTSPHWVEVVESIPGVHRRNRAAMRAGMIETLRRIKAAAEANRPPGAGLSAQLEPRRPPMSRTAEHVDTQEMVVVHRVFRRELRLMPGLIRAVGDGDDRARAAVLTEHLSDVTNGLHHHHAGEDELLWPPLLARVSPQAELVHQMQQQHEQLAVFLDRIRQLTPRWGSEAAADVRDELAVVVAQASAALDEHLSAEEREILPLVARHVTQAEWDALGEYGRQVIPKNSKAFVFIGMILEDATPQERVAFLNLLPRPVRWAWRLLGRRIHRRAMARIRAVA
jgi:iron-sulfur cluster repair protein YtfE (RIC family)